MTAARQPCRLRLTAVIALAYALVLQGLLGALGAGAQAREALLASQLGVMCTIHGAVDPVTGKPGGEDPTPGKLACIEHCVQQIAQPLAEPLRLDVKDVTLTYRVTRPSAALVLDAPAYPSAAPPPPRGPPAI